MRSLRLVVPELGAASFWRLEAGVPFTIGTEGDWAVGGGRLRAIHALAYFDGRALLVASAADDATVRVGGREVGTSWTSIEQPARIELGPIAIEYDAAQAKGGTVRMILPQLAAAPSIALGQGAFAQGAFEQGAIATVKKRKGRWSKVLLSGLGSRGPILVSGAIVAVALVIAAILCVSPARASRRQSLAPKTPPTAHPLPTATASAVASAPAASPRPAGIVVHPTSHPPRRKIGKTEERLAADAFHAGDRKKSAALYLELAAAGSDNPAFATIGRILGQAP